MVKVFTTNSDGKIEFTKDELEEVLNEVWLDGRNSAYFYWWKSPTVTTTYYTDAVNPHYEKAVEITCSPGKIKKRLKI